MIKPDLRSLIGKLNTTCRCALEGAAGLGRDVQAAGIRPQLPRLLLAARDRPVDGRGPAVLWQKRRVILDRAVFRNLHEVLRRELQHESHDADVGVGVSQGLRRFRRPQRLELMNLQAFFLRCRAQRVRPRAFFLRRAKHGHNFVSTREKSFQHCFSEILLTDDCDFHESILMATFLGSDPIKVGGTPDQKKYWMGRVADEALLMAYGATEPQAGSDLAALTTKAVPVERDGRSGYSLTLETLQKT